MPEHGDHRINKDIPEGYCGLCGSWVETYEGIATKVPRYFPHMDWASRQHCPSWNGIVASQVRPIKAFKG